MVPQRLEQQYGGYVNVSSVNQITGSAQPFGVSTPFSVCCLCFVLNAERTRLCEHLSSTWFAKQCGRGPACVCERQTVQPNYRAQKSESQMGSWTSPDKARPQIYARISPQTRDQATSRKWYGLRDVGSWCPDGRFLKKEQQPVARPVRSEWKPHNICRAKWSFPIHRVWTLSIDLLNYYLTQQHFKRFLPPLWILE